MNSYFQFFYNLNLRQVKEKYIHGIPNLNKEFSINFKPDEHGIQFIDGKTNSKKFYLNKKDLIKISVEDQTTIENRIGFKRLLLVGIFALAWKKKSQIPLSFLIIEYKNELGENQEMFIQSDVSTGFQDLTNIKYNLYKVWSEAETNPNFQNEYNFFNDNKKKLDKRNFNIAIFIIAALIFLWLIK